MHALLRAGMSTFVSYCLELVYLSGPVCYLGRYIYLGRYANQLIWGVEGLLEAQAATEKATA